MSSPILPREAPAPPLPPLSCLGGSLLPHPAANDPTLAANQAQPFIIGTARAFQGLKTNTNCCLPQLVCHHGMAGHAADAAAYFHEANANSSQMLVRLAPKKFMGSQGQPLPNCMGPQFGEGGALAGSGQGQPWPILRPCRALLGLIIRTASCWQLVMQSFVSLLVRNVGYICSTVADTAVLLIQLHGRPVTSGTPPALCWPQPTEKFGTWHF